MHEKLDNRTTRRKRLWDGNGEAGKGFKYLGSCADPPEGDRKKWAGKCLKVGVLVLWYC